MPPPPAPPNCCSAAGATCSDFAYFYLGYFIGGGIVLNGSLYLGRRGNAGALASFPVTSPQGQSEQLVHATSLAALEREIQRERRRSRTSVARPRATGRVRAPRWSAGWNAPPRKSPSPRPASWRCSTARPSSSTAPFRCMCGRASSRRCRRRCRRVDRQGLAEFPVLEGTIGADARALGAASLPLFDNFIINRNVLFKEKH